MLRMDNETKTTNTVEEPAAVEAKRGLANSKAVKWAAGILTPVVAATAFGVGAKMNNSPDTNNAPVEVPAVAPQVPGQEVVPGTTLEPAPVDTVAPNKAPEATPAPAAKPTSEAAPAANDESHNQASGKDKKPELPPGIYTNLGPNGEPLPNPSTSPTPDIGTPPEPTQTPDIGAPPEPSQTPDIGTPPQP